jgi:hypothetical protein
MELSTHQSDKGCGRDHEFQSAIIAQILASGACGAERIVRKTFAQPRPGNLMRNEL